MFRQVATRIGAHPLENRPGCSVGEWAWGGGGDVAGKTGVECYRGEVMTAAVGRGSMLHHPFLKLQASTVCQQDGQHLTRDGSGGRRGGAVREASKER